ncbi:hypothetical protein ACFXHA_39905 [Nocardia sp. NPDC059240]|uniref:hypothetical protein n=1 Tax=Nocardia sp. NPDC059240 TaxID=3346786 RepID=UPI003688044A
MSTGTTKYGSLFLQCYFWAALMGVPRGWHVHHNLVLGILEGLCGGIVTAGALTCCRMYAVRRVEIRRGEPV